MNYFGYGNETKYDNQEVDMDYNRVRIRKFNVSGAIRHVGRYGSEFSVQPVFQRLTVEETQNRFIDTPNIINQNVFDSQNYGGLKVKYLFKSSDFAAKPTLGVAFMVAATWLTNLDESKQNFPTLESLLGFTHKIDHNGKLVLATYLKGKAVLNNNYDFYHGATLGGDTDLVAWLLLRFEEGDAVADFLFTVVPDLMVVPVVCSERRVVAALVFTVPDDLLVVPAFCAGRGFVAALFVGELVQSVDKFIKGNRKLKPETLDRYLRPFGLKIKISIEKLKAA